ncbi:putative cell division control protein 31 [Phytophthora infestans]|uniref:Putative cell division control protein 31 n=1 Tax=Phytophthora infestans TaxID=4787 RepID=A0A833T3S8_PHYIN|nr:putative cell division control protein 31 [Phytophthora infestans]
MMLPLATKMTTVMQRIKNERLTAAQERESRVVFELAAEGSKIMTAKQLKLCLRALGFSVTKGEVQALVYEFDYTDANTIRLADFQKILLSKILDTCERDTFEQAFRSMTSETEVSICQLSSNIHATEHLDDASAKPNEEKIDGKVLRQQMALQYYADEEVEAVQAFLDDATELRVSKEALAAFLRVK